MKTSYIIAVDVDGTLHNTSPSLFPYVDVNCLNMPLIRAIEEAQQLRPRDEYILWTCREGDQIQPILEALNKVSNIRWDAINDNVPRVKQLYGNSRKIVADKYIDDCACIPEAGELFLSAITKM